MATIDLCHLANKEYDVIKFIGQDDGLKYELTVKRAAGSILLIQEYMNQYKNGDIKLEGAALQIEIGYMTIAAWIRGEYPKLTLEWVKKNISAEVYEILIVKSNDLFFPPTEKAKPKKKPMAKKPIKKARRS